MSILQLRLKNCIQTILELEPGMEGSEGAFNEDFTSLRTCLARVDQMELAEEDVSLLERAASDFLLELENSRLWENERGRLLQ